MRIIPEIRRLGLAASLTVFCFQAALAETLLHLTEPMNLVSASSADNCLVQRSLPDLHLERLAATNYTVELNCKVDSIRTGSWAQIAQLRYKTGSARFLFCLQENGYGKLNCRVDSTTATSAGPITAKVQVFDGRWHHLAVRIASAGNVTFELLVDGVSQGTNVISGTTGAFASDKAPLLEFGNMASCWGRPRASRASACQPGCWT